MIAHLEMPDGTGIVRESATPCWGGGECESSEGSGAGKPDFVGEFFAFGRTGRGKILRGFVLGGLRLLREGRDLVNVIPGGMLRASFAEHLS